MRTWNVDKVRDIVGLYLNPPDAAVGLCVDEKSQNEALDRTAPIQPLLPGVPGNLEVHVIVDNSSTHKTPVVKNRLLAHPRFVFHFTPTYSSSDEPGRALVRRAYDQVACVRHPPLRRRACVLHPHLDRY